MIAENFNGNGYSHNCKYIEGHVRIQAHTVMTMGFNAM
jgi:hypothetical protein